MHLQSDDQASRDLKLLYNTTEKKLLHLKKLIRKSMENEQNLNQQGQKIMALSWNNLQDSISKLFKYSQYLAKYSHRLDQQKQQQKNELRKTQFQLKSMEKKCWKLQEESMVYRKKLFQKQCEIERLLHLLKIDASYISSVQFKEESEQFSGQQESSIISVDSVPPEKEDEIDQYQSFQNKNDLSSTQEKILSEKVMVDEDKQQKSSIYEEHRISQTSSTKNFVEDLLVLLDESEKEISKLYSLDRILVKRHSSD